MLKIKHRYSTVTAALCYTHFMFFFSHFPTTWACPNAQLHHASYLPLSNRANSHHLTCGKQLHAFSHLHFDECACSSEQCTERHNLINALFSCLCSGCIWFSHGRKRPYLAAPLWITFQIPALALSSFFFFSLLFSIVCWLHEKSWCSTNI